MEGLNGHHHDGGAGSRPTNTRGTAAIRGATAAADFLRELLRTESEYRKRWQRRVSRGHAGDPNVAAVARVIAEYLWDSGERPDSETGLARRLKDRVARALQGAVLTPETLRWFIGAFGIRGEHANRLWQLHSGGGPDFVAHTLVAPRSLVFPQRHHTLAVFEHHHIGPDGRTARHTTVHAITPRHEVVDRYLYVPHVDSVEVTVESGGVIGRRLPFGPGLTALEILLTRQIGPGEVASLRYATRFTLRKGRSTEYRRFAHARTDNVDIRVSFDPACPPSTVWWSVWDDYQGGRVVVEESVRLDAEYAVHRFLGHIEQAVVGFRWAW